MDHLTVHDARFLHAEDANRRVSLAIGGVLTLDGPIPDFESLVTTLGQRIGACPRFAQRLRVHALDYDAPEWVDDAEFDLAHHVKRVALPSPGDDGELYQLVAEIMAWRLDRSRPLWELWVIEGLSDDRWAMLLKVHHCIADATAIAHMVAGLADDGFRETAVLQHDSVQRPAVRLTLPDLNPIPWISGLARAAANLVQPSSSTPLNGPMSNLRRYTAARASLEDIERVCRVFDVTVTDVALAALTDSYRNYLIGRGVEPSSEMLPMLPVEEGNPVQQLRVVHSRRVNAKPTGRPVGSAAHLPFPVAAWAMRLLTRLPHRGVAAVATDVLPGPAEALHVMGRRVAAVIPIPPIAMGLPTGVSVLSYASDLYFGIMADYEAVPDVDALARGVEAAVRRLVARSKRRRPVRDHRGLSLVVSA